MKLLSAAQPAEFVAMNLLGPSKKVTQGKTSNQGIVDQLTKVVRSIQLQIATEATVTSALVKYRVYAYGAFKDILTDSGKQLAAKFLDSFCVILGSKHCFVTA